MPTFLSFPWGFQRILTIRAEVDCQLPLGKSTRLGMGEGQGENCFKSELIQHQSCLCAHIHYQKVLGLRCSPKAVPFQSPCCETMAEPCPVSEPQRWAQHTALTALTQQMSFSVLTCHTAHCHAVTDVPKWSSVLELKTHEPAKQMICPRIWTDYLDMEHWIWHFKISALKKKKVLFFSFPLKKPDFPSVHQWFYMHSISW